MSLKVRMLGIVRETGGSMTQQVEITMDSNVESVIKELINGEPKLGSVLWDREVDSPLPNALILLDGVEVNNLDGVKTSVKNGQELVILSVVHGG